MKCHECHCGFKRKIQQLRHGKKLGLLGVTLLVAHLLWHAAECLVLPAILVAFGSKAVQEDAVGKAPATSLVEQSGTSEMQTMMKKLPYRGKIKPFSLE